jgi:hypothetical protein
MNLLDESEMIQGRVDRAVFAGAQAARRPSWTADPAASTAAAWVSEGSTPFTESVADTALIQGRAMSAHVTCWMVW